MSVGEFLSRVAYDAGATVAVVFGVLSRKLIVESGSLVPLLVLLIVAIPALILGNFLGGWSEGIKDDLDRAALRVTNLAHGSQLSERPSGGSMATSDINKEALAAS